MTDIIGRFTDASKLSELTQHFYEQINQAQCNLKCSIDGRVEQVATASWEQGASNDEVYAQQREYNTTPPGLIA